MNLWDSVSAHFRARRWQEFKTLFPPEHTAPILDVGGTVSYWKDYPIITVVNLFPQRSTRNCLAVLGDGCNLRSADKSFALTHSNSVIEHVGEWENQKAFASELLRVGRAVYCQTPNRWFPVEVHYLTLFFHWFPRSLENYFVVRYLTGWGWLVRPDRAKVLEYAKTVRLLDAKKMSELFPGCEIRREKFLGFTKSLIAVSSATQRSQLR